MATNEILAGFMTGDRQRPKQRAREAEYAARWREGA